ncbi:inositol monophosphatase family protein [Halogeometricum limi]|uniref:fructose-bisphosphatase n=1 Tax=Halogeometricum limi TaxID=555875 RepID=A0A1I6GT78_9EURY|nr:inositol monophosphatase family protein [Halogeometricum limi]SFR45336.1 myo-inositol-1(or 4)-monophosphatase [Halogeometricum limi]
MSDTSTAESDDADDADDSGGATDADLRALADVATRAVHAGGDYLEDAFRDGPVEGEYGTDDVKAAADRAAEERVLSVLRDAYPDHAVHGEESGRDGDHRYEWVVDPLDGTNNFAAGLPSFATAVCALRDGDPVVSAVYEPLPNSTYVARRGGGATVDGEPLSAGSDVPIEHGTVSFVVGLPAVRDPELAAAADRIESALESRCKRVVTTWSPCVDWGLLARGGLEGMVCFHPDVYEQYAGELLAAESGVVSAGSGMDGDGLYVGAGDAETARTLADVAESVLD